MRVFNIPASISFLPCAIDALLSGRLIASFVPRDNPALLAKATLYLPTQRACRAAREVFLDQLGGEAAILPRIIALGNLDEDEIDFAQAASGAESLELPPAMGAFARRLVLTRLVHQWARESAKQNRDEALVVTGANSAIGLADDLARFIDDMITREIDWSRLDRLVPEEHSAYWQTTLSFINDILRNWWPQILHERGLIEATLRRDRLIAAECARLTHHHDGPIIAAGSTGSMPATAKFLHAIARLKDGAVILPGLDRHLDEASWEAIAHVTSDDGAATPSAAFSHPQFSLRGLLSRFNITRDDVRDLAPPDMEGRELLMSETFRPASTTHLWHAELQKADVATSIAQGLQGISIISAANAEDESLAIAAALREAHHFERTAMLVTPDRALARRVIAALGRWNIEADDSGGDDVMETAAGRFALLSAQAALSGLQPSVLLALLKHPLFRLGRASGEWNAAIAAFEHGILRGPRPDQGTGGLLAAWKSFREDLSRARRGDASTLHHSDTRLALDEVALADADILIAQLSACLAPLESCAEEKALPLLHIAQLHRALIEALSAEGDSNNVIDAFSSSDGLELVESFDDLAQESEISALAFDASEYADALPSIFAGRIVRRNGRPGARLRILGPLEARLTQCDRVVLGGLTEGIWPPQTQTDAWLSRAMRQQLGLDAPERRIGLSAHDFVQLIGAKDVIISHSAKSGGTPAVTSRFLHRLQAVASEDAWKAANERGQIYLNWAQQLDWPEGSKATPITQPLPCPARAVRPNRLSVTEIETLIRDPYAIYARHILKVDALDPVDMPLGGAERGSAIHNSIGAFTLKYADELPKDITAGLIEIGRDHFHALMAQPEARALWWPRFARIAKWFDGWERERRQSLTRIFTEIGGALTLDIQGAPFRLSARADRIEHCKDGRYTILDYKTGQVPAAKQVATGLSPQLTLEAAMVRHGAFKDIPAGGSINELVYVRLSGNDPAGEIVTLELKSGGKSKDDIISSDQAADDALLQLKQMLTHYADASTPYRSQVASMWKGGFGRYNQLARISEWSATGNASEDNGDGESDTNEGGNA